MPVPLVRLPPLDLVRGFVAVGRRMSITRAADDLCLTQSAISKQIRALEAFVGTRLLHRGHRSVSLTHEGERLFRVANASIQQLQQAMAAVGPGTRRPVTMTASIGVASLWLVPRLREFQMQNPGIDVRVSSNNALLDLSAEDIDIAIRYCSELQAPHRAEHLFEERIAPVASPALGLTRLNSVEDLQGQVLLEYEDRRPWLQWDHWLAHRGWSTRAARGILRFNQYDQAIFAAAAGQGVALGRLEILSPMFAERRLQVLTSEGGARRSHYSYWLVQADPEPRAEVHQVAHWLRQGASRLDGAGVH